MSDINVFTITGRLTKDGNTRQLVSGKSVTVADVAVNTGYGDYKKTLFVKVQIWGDRGEKIAKYLTKGQLIGCSGELSRNEWGTDGNKKVDFVLDAGTIQLLGNKSSNTKEGEDKEPFKVDEGDIPF